MINIEQNRAKNALSQAEDVKKVRDEGNALAGFPSLIISNGLIATVANAIQKDGQQRRIADAIAFHLSNLPGGTSLLGNRQNANAEALRDRLCKDNDSDAALLKRCTTEAIAFLAYLKRFAA